MHWVQSKFLQRPRRKSEPDLWRLGLDAREVMLARISLALSGRLSAHEARRMVVEKQSAAWRAQLAYLQWLLEGEPAAAKAAAFEIYHRAVHSNRKRLGRRRWPINLHGLLGGGTPEALRRGRRTLQKLLSARPF
jgi:hypothetical protein